MARRKISPPATKQSDIKIKPTGIFSHSDSRLFSLTIAITLVAGIFHNSGGNPIVAFGFSGAALATIANLLGRSIEALGDHLSAGTTGIFKAFLGNLPELFVILFSLKAGLYEVAKATLVGSILAHLLLITGLAFFVGGLKHGRQVLRAPTLRRIVLLLFLSVSALAIPTFTSALNTPAVNHERIFTLVISVLLLLLFVASLIDKFNDKTDKSAISASANAPSDSNRENLHGTWPLNVAFGILGISVIGVAVASDWFVSELTPAIDLMGISEAFAGLVVVAISTNAIMNIAGIKLAAKNRSEAALHSILQSPVRIVMAVAPIVALAAPLVGAATFTLVFSPLLLAVLFIAVIVAVLVVINGAATWFEGSCLLVLYFAIATAFWWG